MQALYDFLKNKVEETIGIEMNDVLKHHGLSKEDAPELLPKVCAIIEDDQIMRDAAELFETAFLLDKATKIITEVTSKESPQIVLEYLESVQEASLDCGRHALKIGNDRIQQIVSEVKQIELECDCMKKIFKGGVL